MPVPSKTTVTLIDGNGKLGGDRAEVAVDLDESDEMYGHPSRGTQVNNVEITDGCNLCLPRRITKFLT